MGSTNPRLMDTTRITKSIYGLRIFAIYRKCVCTFRVGARFFIAGIHYPRNGVYRKPTVHPKISKHHNCLLNISTGRASSVLLFPTFWGLSYFFLLLGKIPTFSYFYRLLLKLIDINAIFKPKNFFGLALLGIISFSK